MRQLLDLILDPAIQTDQESDPDDAQPIISDNKKMHHCRSCGYSEPLDNRKPKGRSSDGTYMITYYCPQCNYEEEIHPRDWITIV